MLDGSAHFSLGLCGHLVFMSHKTARVGDTLLVMVAVYFRYIVFLQVTVSIDFKR